MMMAMDTMGNGRPLDASVRFGAYAAEDPADAGISPVASA